MKRLISPIAIYFVLLAALLAGFFEVWRAITLVILFDRSAAIPASTMAEAFIVGLRFDFAIACYRMLPLAILGALPYLDLIRFRSVRAVNMVLLYILTAAAFFIHLVDIEFFRFFNTRLNAMALEWSDSPNFVKAMIWESFHVVWYLLLFAGIFAAFVFCFRLLRKKFILASRPPSFVATLISLPLLAAVLLLGIRGRVEEKAPLT